MGRSQSGRPTSDRRGDAWFDRDSALVRIEVLGSVCLWCDEYMTKQVRERGDDLAALPVQGERRLIPLATVAGD